MSHAVIHAIGLPPVIFPMGAPQSWTTAEADEDDTVDVTPRCGCCDRPVAEGCSCTKCDECKGSGWYVGATVREHCKKCEGAGWL